MDRPLKLIIYIFILKISLFANLATAKDAQIAIELPKQSNNGSFVVKLLSERNPLAHIELELWRAYEGDDFELISRQTLFNAFSQIVFESGRYTYFAKLYKIVDGRRELVAQSDEAQIDVLRKEYKIVGS